MPRCCIWRRQLGDCDGCRRSRRSRSFTLRGLRRDDRQRQECLHAGHCVSSEVLAVLREVREVPSWRQAPLAHALRGREVPCYLISFIKPMYPLTYNCLIRVQACRSSLPINIACCVAVWLCGCVAVWLAFLFLAGHGGHAASVAQFLAVCP